VTRPRRWPHAPFAAGRALPIAAALALLLGAVVPPARADDPDHGGDPAPESPPPPATPPAPEAPRETVVVTAPADGAAADPSAFSTVIHAADLDEPLLTLPEVLRRAVGVQVRSLGGEFSTVSIRGSSAEQVVVYLDGVPLNDALGGGVNLANVPLAALDSIEIYRGSTPPFLSSASIGGAILLHSRRPAEGSDTGGFASVGSYGTAEVGGSWSHGGARGDGLVGLDFATSEGDYPYHDDNGTPFNPADDGDTPRVNNDFRRGHLTARGGWRAGRARITVGTDLFERAQGVPGTDAWPSTDSRLDTGRMLLHAGAEAPGLAGGRLLLRGLVSHLVQDQEFEGSPGDLGFLTRSTDNRTTSTGAESSGTYALSAHQGLSFLGALRLETADLRDRLLDPSERGNADRRVATLTAEDAIESGAGRVVVTPSLRHERWQSTFEPGPAPGVVPPATDDRDAATTGRVGLRVRLREGLDLRANAGSFLRLPDLTELYGDQGSIVGNPDLVPESGRNADLGVQASFARAGERFHDVRAEAVVFATRAEDLILYVPNAQSTVVARNIGAARIRGVEIGFSFGAGRRFSGSLNATHQEAIDTSDRYTDGKDLPLRPRDEFSASAGLAFGRGHASWDFTYVGPNYTDTINSESGRLPSRYLHDLAYRRPLTGHLEASFEIHNVFDDRTVDVARFPLPGRAFGARLQWAY
jgi:vitamin B12 transporter